MWTHPEEARSDFILAAAVAVLGPLLVNLVLNPVLQGIPASFDPLLVLVNGVIIFALTGLVPLLLVRYRNEGVEAFGLDVGRDGVVPGVLVSLPVVAAAVYASFDQGRTTLETALGSLGFVTGGPANVLATIVDFVAISVGLGLLYSFLTVKARTAFSHQEVTQLEMLRMFGMGAAGVALLIGLLTGASGRVPLLGTVVEAAALAAMVLLTDRYVAPRVTTSRWTVLAPAIVALVLGIDLLGGEFLFTLRHGLLGAGFVIVAAVLVETRRYAWALLPLFALATIYRTPLLPI